MAKFTIEKIQVVDEILEATPKYNIIDENGNAIGENCEIEMVTTVWQEGTPLNKVLFDKINYLGQCIAYLGGGGDDVYKFITTGEYNNSFTDINEITEYKIQSLEKRIEVLEGGN